MKPDGRALRLVRLSLWTSSVVLQPERLPRNAAPLVRVLWFLVARGDGIPHPAARSDSISRATRAFSIRSSRSTLSRLASAARSPRRPRLASWTIASRTASDWLRPDPVRDRSASWASSSRRIEIAFSTTQLYHNCMTPKFDRLAAREPTKRFGSQDPFNARCRALMRWPQASERVRPGPCFVRQPGTSATPGAAAYARAQVYELTARGAALKP